jgi:hypothetical protein
MYCCAWCQRPIDRLAGTRLGEQAVEHGICRRCLDQKLMDLSRGPTEPRFPLVRPQPDVGGRERLDSTSLG